jgi:hypothetical protein
MTTREWRVETRVTATRIYFVKADNEKEAEAKSCDATPDFDEVDNEETLSITQITGDGADGESQDGGTDAQG